MGVRLSGVMKEFIANLPGKDGWWHTSGREDFERIARMLLSYEIPEEDVTDILGRVYGDVANEFGA